MPEIGEVARIVHYLKKHTANKLINSVKVQEDNIIYGKVGTSATAFQKAMSGKRIVDAKQQGKYFWLEMDSPPHPVMHLGMTGWIKFSNDNTSHYGAKKVEAKETEEWPPRFWKFILEVGDQEVAFVDARRLARIRLVDVDAAELRNTTPLKENGPDPVIDKDVLTLEWLTNKLRSKRVPVKALLLDQANISGVGNWVADEVLYQARIHPEQYSNSFSDEQMAALHKALMHVCDTAVGTLADSNSFPETWLMKYRWDKGKKNANVLPNGDKIVHLKVGGRTSAIVPRVQKKTGKVAGDVSESAEERDEDEDVEEEDTEPKPKATKRKAEDKPSPAQKRGRKPKKEEDEEASDVEDVKPAKKRQSKKVKEEEVEAEDVEEKEVKPKAKKAAGGDKAKKETTAAKGKKTEPSAGKRRSGRLSGQSV